MNKILLFTSKLFGCNVFKPRGAVFNHYYGVTLFTILVVICLVSYHNLITIRKLLLPIVRWTFLSVMNMRIMAATFLCDDDFWNMMTALKACIESIELNPDKLSKTKKCRVIDELRKIKPGYNYFLFFLMHAFYFGLLVPGFLIWKYNIELIQEYIYLTWLLFAWEVLNTLEESMKGLNRSILEWSSARQFLSGKTNAPIRNRIITISEGKAPCKDFREIENFDVALDAYITLVEHHNDVILNFNRHFGWNMIISTAFSINDLLSYGEAMISNRGNISSNWTAIVPYFLSTVILLHLKSEQVNNERATTKLLLQKLWNRFSKQNGGEFAEKLQLLMFQFSIASDITAKGFFVFSHAMVFMLLNIVITYLAVMVQLDEA